MPSEMRGNQATPRAIEAVSAALGGAYTYDGVLLNPERLRIYGGPRTRWAAFTDDELSAALAEIGETPDWRRGGSGFREEIAAELDRRRTL